MRIGFDGKAYKLRRGGHRTQVLVRRSFIIYHTLDLSRGGARVAANSHQPLSMVIRDRLEGHAKATKGEAESWHRCFRLFLS